MNEGVGGTMPGEQDHDNPDDPTDDEVVDVRCVLCARVIDLDGEGEWPSYDLFELRSQDGRHLGLIEVCDGCLAAGRVPATVRRA